MLCLEILFLLKLVSGFHMVQSIALPAQYSSPFTSVPLSTRWMFTERAPFAFLELGRFCMLLRLFATPEGRNVRPSLLSALPDR